MFFDLIQFFELKYIPQGFETSIRGMLSKKENG